MEKQLNNREIKFRAWDGEQMLGDEKSKIWLMQKLDKVFMQYTGLKDKNGKEIYEGDIIKQHNNHKGKVIWVDGYACFGYEYIGGGGIMANIDDINIEVIGNIYENPELLK